MCVESHGALLFSGTLIGISGRGARGRYPSVYRNATEPFWRRLWGGVALFSAVSTIVFFRLFGGECGVLWFGVGWFGLVWYSTVLYGMVL